MLDMPKRFGWFAGRLGGNRGRNQRGTAAFDS
jgi:hypothetical protein